MTKQTRNATPPTSLTSPIVATATGLALGGGVLLFAMVLAFAAPALLHGGESGTFSWSWRPYQGEFGILPMLVGSLLLSLSTLLLAWPLALGAACWALGQRPGPALRAFQTFIRLMTAIPTVVYGFAAVFLLTPLLRQGLGGSGMCWLGASLMLALLVLPTMVLVLESGLRPRLERITLAGQALGLGRRELLLHVVVPGARATLLAAALLGFGRAVGDTLLPLMLAGNAPQIPGSPGASMRALTAHMALVTANEVGGAAYNSLFAAGALLLAVNAAVSLCARKLAGHRNEKQAASL